MELSKTVRLDILSPPGGPFREKGFPKQQQSAKWDDNSLVTRITYRGKRFLLLSDAGPKGQARLIEQPNDLRSNVLVVGRHGKRGGASLEILLLARPEVCIVPVGISERPSRLVLRQIDPKNTGADLYRTDLDGIVEVVTDGQQIVVNREVGRG